MPDSSIVVLADTSFFIRLLKEDDPLHDNARAYLKYLLERNAIILCSTIAISEYCVRGGLEELPLKLVQVVPFNVEHAVRSGEFARLAFASRVQVEQRVIIPNDCKLFAQAAVEGAGYYLTSDARSRSIYDALRKGAGLSCESVDIRIPVHEAFGFLDLH